MFIQRRNVLSKQNKASFLMGLTPHSSCGLLGTNMSMFWHSHFNEVTAFKKLKINQSKLHRLRLFHWQKKEN